MAQAEPIRVFVETDIEKEDNCQLLKNKYNVSLGLLGVLFAT